MKNRIIKVLRLDKYMSEWWAEKLAEDLMKQIRQELIDYHNYYDLRFLRVNSSAETVEKVVDQYLTKQDEIEREI